MSRLSKSPSKRLLGFQQKLGEALSFPIDIELFGDLVLGLSMLMGRN